MSQISEDIVDLLKKNQISSQKIFLFGNKFHYSFLNRHIESSTLFIGNSIRILQDKCF